MLCQAERDGLASLREQQEQQEQQEQEQVEEVEEAATARRTTEEQAPPTLGRTTAPRSSAWRPEPP